MKGKSKKHYVIRLRSLVPILIITIVISVMSGIALAKGCEKKPESDLKEELGIVSEVEVEPSPVIEVEEEPFFPLSEEERRVAEYIVMGEAEGESYEGKVLVAQCILNACLKDDIQPSEVRTKYKYSGWNENPSEEVKEAVKAVFDEGYAATEEPILYFYAPEYGKSKWHESQRYIITEGGHRFFALWQ